MAFKDIVYNVLERILGAPNSNKSQSIKPQPIKSQDERITKTVQGINGNNGNNTSETSAKVDKTGSRFVFVDEDGVPQYAMLKVDYDPEIRAYYLIGFQEDCSDEIEEVMMLSAMSSRGLLIGHAINLYHWCINEVIAGRDIASITPLDATKDAGMINMVITTSAFEMVKKIAKDI